MKQKKVIIIGCGIGGLALANILILKNYDVEVYEKNSFPGGKAGLIDEQGYRFDSGPSWYLMPEIFEHFFELINQNLSDYLKLEKLSPAYRVFFEDQQIIDIFADRARDQQTFENIEPGAGKKLENYLTNSSIIYDLAIQNFLYSNFQKPLSLINKNNLKQLPLFLKIRTKSLDHYVRQFFRDEHLIKILEYQSVFLGTSPYNLPAIYSLMSHIDFNQGVYYPRGGIYQIIDSLYRIANQRGVKFFFNQPVQKIEVKNYQAKAIKLKSKKIVKADIIVSNSDMYYTENQLLNVQNRSFEDDFWSKKQLGPSAILLYLGVKADLKELQHHNLLFVDNWKKNFDEIYGLKQWPLNNSIYLSRTSLSDTTVAPKGCENLFALIPGPSGSDSLTQEALNSLVDNYIDEIGRFIKVDNLQQKIVYKKIFSPNDFEKQFNSWQSSALGLSHILSQSAFFRPTNRSKKVNNLFYVGSSTMPGIGLPMCLISAELVYKRLINDNSNQALKKL